MKCWVSIASCSVIIIIVIEATGFTWHKPTTGRPHHAVSSAINNLLDIDVALVSDAGALYLRSL